MTQVFVIKNDLSAGDDTMVRVHGWYPDFPPLPNDLHGSTAVPITLPNTVPIVTNNTIRVLHASWRDAASTIVNGEAARRITEVFPDYKQSNANAEMNSYVTQFGFDSTQWPSDKQSRKAEIDRAWHYVADVRTASNAMAIAMPPDPTDDTHWPTRVPPYTSGL